MSMLKIQTRPQYVSDEQRQYNWEHGQIDYLGADSFDNILQQLDAKLATPPEWITSQAVSNTSRSVCMYTAVCYDGPVLYSKMN